jgi:SAM-dependent methyltransferase
MDDQTSTLTRRAEGGQHEQWRRFYQHAWAFRAEFMRARIGEGETNPYRIIKRLEAHERKYELASSDEQTVFQRRAFAPEHGMTPAGTPVIRRSSFRGQGIAVPFHAVAPVADFIIDFIEQTGPYDAIIELGCGYGRNLFEIFYRGGPGDSRYFGGELAPSGVEIAGELAALDPRMQARFFHHDHLAPDFAHLPRFDRVLVFTVHSLEQVWMIHPALFQAMAGLGREVAGIHLEPFGFQTAKLGPVTEAHAALVRKNGWNENFAAALQQARENRWVNVTYASTEIFLPQDPENPTSLAIWTSPC